MRIIYIADDGKEFDDEWNCKFYEWRMEHIHLNDIRFYEKNGRLLTSSPFSDLHYNKTETIIVPNEEALKDLHALAEYTGFCDYDSINEVGTWIHYYDGFNSGFALKED